MAYRSPINPYVLKCVTKRNEEIWLKTKNTENIYTPARSHIAHTHAPIYRAASHMVIISLWWALWQTNRHTNIIRNNSHPKRNGSVALDGLKTKLKIERTQAFKCMLFCCLLACRWSLTIVSLATHLMHTHSSCTEEWRAMHGGKQMYTKRCMHYHHHRENETKHVQERQWSSTAAAAGNCCFVRIRHTRTRSLHIAHYALMSLFVLLLLLYAALCAVPIVCGMCVCAYV